MVQDPGPQSEPNRVLVDLCRVRARGQLAGETEMRVLYVLLALLVSVNIALAQGQVRLCYDVSGQTFCTGVTPTTPLPVTQATAVGAIQGNSTGSTGAVVGTLAGVAGKTTYICGFSVSAIGGTATVGPITIAGPTTSLVFYLASTATGVVLNQSFAPCIPASAANTAITTTTTADGTATAVAVNSWGYQQ